MFYSTVPFTIGESRDQLLTKLKENGKYKYVTFSKWLEILAGEVLPPELHSSENGN